MGIELFIMRHGPAERTSASGKDEDRELTEPGRERVRGVARALLAAGEVPQEILTSTLVRARETAAIVRSLTTVKAPLVAARALSMTNGVRGLIDEHVSRNLDRRMLVGHEPELSSVILGLTGEVVHMEAGIVVGITLTRDGARVRFVLEPKTFAMTR